MTTSQLSVATPECINIEALISFEFNSIVHQCLAKMKSCSATSQATSHAGLYSMLGYIVGKATCYNMLGYNILYNIR